MKSAFKILKAVDLMSPGVENTIEYNQRIKNWFGGLITLILLVILVVFGLVFGKEMVMRQNPFTSTVRKVFDESSVNLTEFPIAFSLLDAFGNDLSLNTTFMDSIYMSAQLWQIPTVDSSEGTTRVKYPIVECTQEYMDKEELDLINESMGSFKKFCFDFSEGFVNKEAKNIAPIVKNEYGEKNSAFFYFFISRCRQEGILCNEFKAPHDIFYIKLFTRGKYLDLKDFYNPAKKIVSSLTLPASYTLSKRDFVDVEIEELVSDEGWLFQQENRENWFQLGNISQTIDFQTEENSLMYGFTFSSPKLRNVNYRRYTKIQEWMAQVGGFLKGFSIVFKFICIPFSNYVFYSKMNMKIKSDTQLVNNLVDTDGNSKIAVKTGINRSKLKMIEFFTAFWKIKETKEYKEIGKYLEITYVAEKIAELEVGLRKIERQGK